MTKTRLNERVRNVLRGHARKLVSCQVEKAAADKAYKATAAALRKMIEARYPLKDMVILKRYDMAGTHHCIRLQLTPGGYQVWNYRPDDKPPLQPGSGQAYQVYIADESTTAAVQQSLKMDEALKAALGKRLGDYYSLIAAATTFEAVCEVWPEAEQVRSQCGATAIVVAVTPAVVARIRADVASRAKAA